MNVTTMINWYEDEKKVMELAEFLVQSEEISSTEELLEYFKRPERYTEVWNIYEKEILGTRSISRGLLKKEPSCALKKSPVSSVVLVEPCACLGK